MQARSRLRDGWCAPGYDYGTSSLSEDRWPDRRADAYE
jgi:hypothetical protein